MDVLIKNGLVFSGDSTPPKKSNIFISNGVIQMITTNEIPENHSMKVIDANGNWVMPGFIDFHTHYDAEIEAAPGLTESLRHGVTTVSLGSCSLSLALGTPEDLADMFSRVEAIPREEVLPLLQKVKNWNSLRTYKDHLNSLPLGPNVTSFIGHSCLRAHVMGLERSLTKGVKPTRQEMDKMNALLEDALQEGYMGMSINTLIWDKMDGKRFRSRPLPSTFANWSEYRHFNRTLRKWGRIFQGVPNVSSKYNLVLFMAESVGLFRKKLKTTIISMMDVKSNRFIYKLLGALSRILNKLFNADFKYQSLPEVFDLYADGVDVVVFEEFGAGTAAIHLQDMVERKKLLQDSKYRSWFRRQWTNIFLPRIFHRDFNDSKIVECPDASLVGKSFYEVSKERKQHVVDCFLDLCAEYGNDIRWYTVIANDRLEPLQTIVSHPDVMIGFSDAGAHLRGMAHYNFPLRLLKLVRDAELAGKPFMTMEKAISRVTGELADWLGIDAGHIEIGKRADIVIVRPEFLNQELGTDCEAPMPEFGNFVRLVRRNNKTVQAVLVNGKIAVIDGEPISEVGKSKDYGKFLECYLGNNDAVPTMDEEVEPNLVMAVG
ncbi:N-acyl-D-amino-acid deacylase family protein [Leptospira sp. GIMC2001]|uniref:N-acyl-D-amino-acid deacylase family protein n=1 Tax=Leptospira sp. GIMC2001 TaxID=1513297 RepID=UPI002349280D|nr:amidohydrolase family protein [Leptospira sp. GIMC2001]WCL50232.1 amidohydrolase family protein [Leptospira sp. GIMC2001]